MLLKRYTWLGDRLVCIYTCRRGHTCVCMYDLYTSCTCVIFPCQEIALVVSVLWRTVSPSGFDENSPASILGECFKYLVEIQHLLSLAFSSIYIKKRLRGEIKCIIILRLTQHEVKMKTAKHYTLFCLY